MVVLESEAGNPPLLVQVQDNAPHLPPTLPVALRQSSRHDGFCWVGQGGWPGADMVFVYPGQQLRLVWSLGHRELAHGPQDQRGVHPLEHGQLCCGCMVLVQVNM